MDQNVLELQRDGLSVSLQEAYSFMIAAGISNLFILLFYYSYTLTSFKFHWIIMLFMVTYGGRATLLDEPLLLPLYLLPSQHPFLLMSLQRLYKDYPKSNLIPPQ